MSKIFPYTLFYPNITSFTLKLKQWALLPHTLSISCLIPRAPYQTMSSVVPSPAPPLSHQVTQEEVFICPSHAAVLANYSDLMCGLAAICGDARCYCINTPAPSVVSIINRRPSLVGAGVTLQRKPQCTGTRCDTARAVGPSSRRVGVHKSAQMRMWPTAIQHLTPPPFAHMTLGRSLPPSPWNQSRLSQVRPQHHSAI